MLYFDLKTTHVLVAGLLLFSVVWTYLPLFLPIQPWPRRVQQALRRGVCWVIPVGFVQGILGMATFSLDHIGWQTPPGVILWVGFLLLGLLWLGVLFCLFRWHQCLLDNSSDESVLVKRFQRITWILTTAISIVFFIMLYVMVNIRSGFLLG